MISQCIRPQEEACVAGSSLERVRGLVAQNQLALHKEKNPS